MSEPKYLYYKGEKSNPFDQSSQTDPSAMFWFYESQFAIKFRKDNWGFENWKDIAPTAPEKSELKRVLESNDVDELFKLFMFHILMERLPERNQDPRPTDKYIKLYYSSE